MPKFYKNYEEKENDSNKNSETTGKQILMFDFYWRLFSKNKLNRTDEYKQVFKNHILLFNKLKKLSEEFVIISKDEEKIDKILYQGLIPLDLSPKNLLFLKFLKFHTGFSKFNLLYGYNQFEDFLIDENLLREYLTKNLVYCLKENKNKNNLKELNDFQLISNICVKERLMLFNFLTDNKISFKDAKTYINNMYLTIYKDRKADLKLSNSSSYKLDNFIDYYTNNI
jgi:hypothetical protein